MRGGHKSVLVDPMLKSAGVAKLPEIPPKPSSASHYCVDLMYLIRSIPITDEMKSFEDFTNKACDTVYNMPATQIDIAGDRYDKSSAKDDTRKGRAKKTKASNKKIKKVAVEKILTPESEFPANEKDFHLLYRRFL